VVVVHSMVAGMAALGAWLASGIGPAPESLPITIAGESAPPPLRIDCPVLDTESRAAFEARARAEMALLPQPAGEIAVACERQAAHVGWRAANGWTGQRVVGLNSDSATLVDSLLGAVHALRAGSMTSPPPLVSGDNPAPAPRLAVTVATGASNPARPAGLRVGLEAALYGEVWEGSMAGGLEGQAGLRFDTRSRWELALTGGWGRGMEPAAGIEAHTWSVMAGVAHIPVRNLEVEAGGLWRSLTFTREATTHRHASTAGLYGAVRYVLARGRFAVAVGPHLSLLSSQIVIDVDGTELFRVPRFVTGLSVGGRVDFNR
jgi:hypothetical protein